MPTIYEQCQTALAEAIRGLSLDGLADERVYERIRSYDTGAVYPCVEVTFEEMRESCELFDSENMLWTFPLSVMILTRGDVDTPAIQSRCAEWRTAIMDRVKADKLGVDGEQRRAQIEAEWTFIPKRGPEWLRVAGGFVVKVFVVAPRP